MDKLRIVMFPHPADEFEPSKPLRNGKDVPCGWNMGKHARRFLLSDGGYVDKNGVLRTGRIAFWSEWEANTLVTRLPPAANCPPGARYVHKPQYPMTCPTTSSLGRDGYCCMNTDPCVFGGSFKYALCRQYAKGKPTVLQELTPGSLIVFCGRKMRQFYLDTVFVVGEKSPYIGPDKNPSVINCSSAYRTLTLDQTRGRLSFYRGVTWQGKEKYGNMYSFAPGRIVTSNIDESILTPALRERCRLDFQRLNNLIGNGSRFFNEKNWRTAKSIDVTDTVVRCTWEELVRQTRQNSFYPAVHFEWPLAKGATGGRKQRLAAHSRGPAPHRTSEVTGTTVNVASLDLLSQLTLAQ